jgi:hypothetical protein
VALLIDVAALWQILIRLGTMGITPNKMAALGENVLVMINLARTWLPSRSHLPPSGEHLTPSNNFKLVT